MHYQFNPKPSDLLSGQVDAAILVKGNAYLGWTRDWEGPARPDIAAAKADLRDRFEAEAIECLKIMGGTNAH